MGIEAITHTDDGELVVPSSQEDWHEWVSATQTRNYLLHDPLLDWLNLYGEANGFQKDPARPGYDVRTDFGQFIFRKGLEFEEAVLKHLKTLTCVVTIGQDRGDVRRQEKAEETFVAMERGELVIYQGILRNAENCTYGIADLMIRSDELARLFPDALTPEEAAQPARDLKGSSWHYRIIDIKFTTLHLAAGGEPNNSGSAPANKAQLFIYNRALGRIQGYQSPVSYLIGRGWEQTAKDVTSRGDNCMGRLAPVNQNSTLSKGALVAGAVSDALKWVRRVRREGATWSVLPKPTVPELRPNLKHAQDYPWSFSKKRVAKELDDLTLLWYVGVEKRNAANNAGIFSWRDPNCTANSLGVGGDKTLPTLQAMLDINQSKDDPLLKPSRISSAEGEWREVPKLEFYVDFETVTDLNDDFSQIPKKGGQPLIFMIGCGHIEEGKWQFECFTAESLETEVEANVIDSWITHMKMVRERLDPKGDDPLVIHWSPAETINLDTAYNSAVKRHPKRSMDWLEPRWFDFLKQVIKEEPVVVRGAFGFGLKAVAQAMHNHGYIETLWEDGPADGLGAMAGAWWCNDEAKKLGVPLQEIDLMRGIQKYNEVDCKVMMEIVRYFRLNH